MAVFRVPKNKDFTMMANYHLKDKEISLKAKGLQSLMLSLPENWDYTLKGLSNICRDGVDSIRSAVRELELHGYIDRRQTRTETGRLSQTEYTIREKPYIRPPLLEKPLLEKPLLENPLTGNPTAEEPLSEKSTQLSTKESNTYLSSTQSYPSEIDDVKRRETYREIIYENISYETLLEAEPYEKERIDELIEIMLDTLSSTGEKIRIGDYEYPTAIVKSRFLKIGFTHMQYVLETLKKNTTQIWNIRKYMLATLYNAPATIKNYYSSQVSYDMSHAIERQA